MGRQGSVVSTPPPAAVQSPPAAMPPMPPKPPKKRYLMENPPRPANGLLQLVEVASPQRPAPPVGAPVSHSSPLDHGHPLAGYAPQPPSHILNGGCVARPCVTDEDKPLNLTTAATTEVKLSRIVDRVVEKMLKSGGMDNGRSGDPLRLWFTNQFETRQRNECSSSGSSPSPRQKSVSPQLPSPAAAAGSPGQPSPGAIETSDGGMMELRIGMSDTINRVIDNVYRQQSQPPTQTVVSSAAGSKRCEVSSCSSDSVNSTTSLLEPSPPPPPPRPPPSSLSTKRRSPPATAVSAAERRAERTQRVKRTSSGGGSVGVVVTAPPVFSVASGTSANVEGVQPSSPAIKRPRPGPPFPNDRLPAPGSDDDECSRSGLVIDEGHPVGAGQTHPAASDAHDAPDSRSSECSPSRVDQSAAAVDQSTARVERSSPLLERSSPLIDRSPVSESPGSPRRRQRKRNAPADSRLGDGSLPDSGIGGRGSRKRKVGKEEIVRIQKDGEGGPDIVAQVAPAKDKSKSPLK